MIKNYTKKLLIIFAALTIFSFAVPVFAFDWNGTIDAGYKYGWNENMGWINFGCLGCNIHVRDNYLTGYAWSSQYGWINLAPTNGGVTNTCMGALGGTAWSSNLGWIDFTGAFINASGIFYGTAGHAASSTGRLTFECTNCAVHTDWRPCALRPTPPQVIINSITDNTVPTIVANVTLTNEGTYGAEYPYEWCVVTTAGNACGGADDVFYSSASKYLNPGEDFITNLGAVVNTPGDYYFKLNAFYGDSESSASISFTAINEPSGGGGGGGGGTLPPAPSTCNGADFNHDTFVNAVDFSILLYYWKTTPPFKNPCVDLNSDNKVDSIDFSIMLSQWGTIRP